MQLTTIKSFVAAAMLAIVFAITVFATPSAREVREYDDYPDEGEQAFYRVMEVH